MKFRLILDFEHNKHKLLSIYPCTDCVDIFSGISSKSLSFANSDAAVYSDCFCEASGRLAISFTDSLYVFGTEFLALGLGAPL